MCFSELSDPRIVTKRPDESFRCQTCSRSFSELHYLTHHKREEHGPRVHCRHCNASFAQCRRFQLRDHEKNSQEQSYPPRGCIRLERESRGQSQSPRVQRGSGGLGAALLRQRDITSLPDPQIFPSTLATPVRHPGPLQGIQNHKRHRRS